MREFLMSVPSQFRGWTIAEAIRRTVSCERLCARAAAHRAWRTAGRHTHFVYHNEDIHGREARHHNARESERHRLYDNITATHRTLLEELRGLLLRKRLLAWGRRESPLVAPQPMPPAAWKLLDFRDPRASTLREATAQKTEVFDVRIFPVLEAPNALKHLSGMTLTETFRDFVFGDPQWEVLRRRAKAKGDKILEPSHQHLLYSAFWPTYCGQGDWSGMLFYLNSHPGSVGHLADLVVGRRFSRLISYLSSGQLLANGTAADGKTVEVPRSLWARRQTHIDVSNGDLIEYRENARERWEWYSEPIFKGIILRKAEEMFPVKHMEHAQLLPSASVSPGTAAIPPTRPKSPKRRPVAEDVAQALRKNGIEREPGPRTWKQIASMIAHDLSRQPRNDQEWDALTTAVRRHFKSVSQDSAEAASKPTK